MDNRNAKTYMQAKQDVPSPEVTSCTRVGWYPGVLPLLRGEGNEMGGGCVKGAWERGSKVISDLDIK